MRTVVAFGLPSFALNGVAAFSGIHKLAMKGADRLYVVSFEILKKRHYIHKIRMQLMYVYNVRLEFFYKP